MRAPAPSEEALSVRRERRGDAATELPIGAVPKFGPKLMHHDQERNVAAASREGKQRS